MVTPLKGGVCVSIVGRLTENWPDRGHGPANRVDTVVATHRPMAADVVSTGAPSPRTLLTVQTVFSRSDVS